MQNNKRRAFWFSLGIAATITVQHLIGSIQPEPIEPGKRATITQETRNVWNLVRHEFPGEDPRPIIHRIGILNPGLDLGTVQIGQQITLPKGE